ncbi:alpha/beta hydrolase family protein [Actinomadura pelletieri DSM 43383]|uniref:Alpha/beta hydrolase family protein n=1 Tax=Actinomadura pelletieri DSM 43383 TaxID=1120940 RepID=A0A495QN52_9ACTN|nr:alpha/beta hydrolase [Actinomadura pelletieri]RKS74381.1 alpha/beta hydrolase family protein [Actinomadura pelletieri DSM 43383]
MTKTTRPRALIRGLGVPGIALTLAVPVTAVSATSGPSLAPYQRQHVHWADCRQVWKDDVGAALARARVECAQITVPLDYARPDGRTIKIALSRIRATDRTHRIGTLMLNRGGPGEPTLGMPVDTRRHMGKLAERYDIIGMDPRFVGHSTPLDCGWPVGLWIRSAGTDRAGFDRQTAFQKDLAERCGRRHGDVLPHVNTRNTARDMDIVRAVLGERRISYLGYSYGAYLGAVYTQLFPGRTDRVVLDSAVDPRRAGPGMLWGHEPALERALHAWATWAAKRHGEYGLGASRSAVLTTVQQVVQAASVSPLRVGDYSLDEHVVPYLIYGGVGNDREEARASFSATMKVLNQATSGDVVAPTPDLEGALSFLLNGENSRFASPAAAIICGDRAAPRDPEVYWRDIERRRKRHPLFGPITSNLFPCAFWPQAPREAPPAIGNATPALIVAATGDTATTYRSSRAMHRHMSGSRLLTLRGTVAHGIYGEYGDPCVDKKVNAYLESGGLPAGNLTCPPHAASLTPRANPPT